MGFRIGLVHSYRQLHLGHSHRQFSCRGLQYNFPEDSGFGIAMARIQEPRQKVKRDSGFLIANVSRSIGIFSNQNCEADGTTGNHMGFPLVPLPTQVRFLVTCQVSVW